MESVRTRIPARMDTDVDREIEAIVKLLMEKGPLPSPQIRRELET